MLIATLTGRYTSRRLGLRSPVPLARLRAQFLAARPEQPALIEALRKPLDELRTGGDLQALLNGLTGALRADPLALDLQTQYWEVWRKLKGDPLVAD